MKQMLIRVDKAENEIKKIEEKWGISVKEARASLKKIETEDIEGKEARTKSEVEESRSPGDRPSGEKLPRGRSIGWRRNAVFPLRS